jgi:sugar phosphate isomerase/epimerase
MKPDEDWRTCLTAMTPFTNYLHLKNLYGIRIPELQRTIFKRGPLWDGVVDFRYLLTHMKASGYDGYCVIEGAGAGDMLYNFEQGLHYVRKLLSEI